jgi:hypothetical protein
LAPDESLASITGRPARILAVAACLLLGSPFGHAQARKVPGFHAGASATQVEKYLNELRIPFELKEESSSANKGTFLRTEPGPGSELRGGTLIVVVSSGPAQPTQDLSTPIPTAPASQSTSTPGASSAVAAPMVRVPGWRRAIDYRDVVAYLTDKGYNVILPPIPVKNESPAGQFLYTEPRGSALMQAGTGIRVFYSEGPAQAPLELQLPAVHGQGKTALQQWIDRMLGYATGRDSARFWPYLAIAGLAAVFLVRWCVRLIRKIINRPVPDPVPPSLPGISARLVQGERPSPPLGTRHRTVTLTARRGPPDQSLMRLHGEGESS